jgi:hypothetical protein
MEDLNRKLKRIILDLEELEDERYIDSDSRKIIGEVVKKLSDMYITSTEV